MLRHKPSGAARPDGISSTVIRNIAPLIATPIFHNISTISI